MTQSGRKVIIINRKILLQVRQRLKVGYKAKQNCLEETQHYIQKSKIINNRMKKAITAPPKKKPRNSNYTNIRQNRLFKGKIEYKT